MLSKYGRALFQKPLAWLAQHIQKTGITPNGLSYIGFALTALSAILLAMGHIRWGGLVLFAGAMFDMLDGSLARATNQTSKFGAFLDSTLDRYAESITLLALVFYYITFQPASRTELFLLFLTMVGSLMVSYTRARAESLQVDCKVGILQRPERIVFLIAGMLTGWMLPVLWILAVFTNVTALQRVYEVYWRTTQQTGSQNVAGD
jgi:CDP-diacylglycerol--glycerol-3-phosphate 3-phosphatidyltransferase